MRKILIIGATSSIAEATERIFAERGDQLFLVGRSSEKLQAVADDLKVRGSPEVGIYSMDANDFDAHLPMLDAADRMLGKPDTVLIAHGTLSDQQACQQSAELTMTEIRTNALSAIALLTHIANRLEIQNQGTIVVIGSVAGDRGRQSNYVYGSAKAMVAAFLSGLRQRLHKSGVVVITIKPGFIDTPMTRNFNKGPLWATPQHAALNIAKIIVAGKGGEYYVPRFWRLIMLIITHIPESIFKRLTL